MLMTCSFALAEERVIVFAAASLQGALQDVAEVYPGETVISYGGSGAIARQVAQGAPADVVILANTLWMDWLENNRVVDLDTPQEVLGNRLVVVGKRGAAPLENTSWEHISLRLEGGRLAIGQTMGVPAGIYARAWLSHIGIWDAMRTRLAETENVRAALALVARGETPLGIVYATDAMAEQSVEVVYAVPRDEHPPIIYPAAALPASSAGRAFLAHLVSDKSQAIFRTYGFLAPGAGR